MSLRTVARGIRKIAWSVGDRLASLQRRVSSGHPLYARASNGAARLSAYVLSGDIRFKNFLTHIGAIERTAGMPVASAAASSEKWREGWQGSSSFTAGSAAPVQRRMDVLARAGIRLQLHRRNALGDVLLITAVLPEIRRKYPGAHLTVTTRYPEILEGNPFIDEIVWADQPLQGFDETIHFTYELSPDDNIVDAYARNAGVAVDDRTPQLFLSVDEFRRANEILVQHGIDLNRPICAFHMASGWPIRNWPLPYFEAVARALADDGVQVVLLGEKAEPLVPFGTDLRGTTTLREVAAIVSKCSAMLAVDSGLMHLATAARIPVVSLFGCTDPEKRLPQWALKWTIYSDIICRGCLHRQRPLPVQFAPQCPWETVRCMVGLKVDAALGPLRAALQQAAKPKVSIVIPHYNGFEIVDACLQSIFRHGARESFEVLVVDDGSTDQSPAMLAHWAPRIRFLQNPQNSGFAATCNAGLRAARGDYVLFLNNDTTVTAGWLDDLVAVLDDNPNVGLVGPKLLFPNGLIQHCGSVVNENVDVEHLYRALPGNFAPANRPRLYRALTGACLMGRREELIALGGLDTEFHMGSEDTDLCYRFVRAGRTLYYCPTSVVYHHEGFTRGRWDESNPQEAKNRALLRSRWSSLMTEDMSDYCLLAVIEAAERRTWLRLQDVPVDIRSQYDTPANRRFARHPFRCELVNGCEPEPGFIRFGSAPELDVVHDAAKPLPLVGDCVGEFVARHVIDHLNWKELPPFLAEVHRVLMPGGRACISARNLRTIVDSVASGSIVPGHGGDESAIAALYGQVSPGLSASAVLFGAGPDAGAQLCIEPPDLQQLCLRVGFSSATVETFGRECAAGEFQLVAVK